MPSSTISRMVSARTPASFGAPMNRVPRARWLWVAMGTSSTMRSISSSPKPSLAQRRDGLVADEALGAGAGVHALRGDPDQPPGGARGCTTAMPMRPYISWVGMSVTGVRFSTG